MSQILNIILFISSKIPTSTKKVYDAINLVSNINLNFSFTQPLSMLKDRTIFGKASAKYSMFGYEGYSFFYNTQSLLISYLALFALYKILCRIQVAISTKTHCIYKKIRAMLLGYTKGFSSIIFEMYFQQRIMVYFVFYMFIMEYKKAQQCYLGYLIRTVDFLEVILFIIADVFFMKKYIGSFMDRIDRYDMKPVISIQFELMKANRNLGVVQFEIDCLIIQMICPLLVEARLPPGYALIFLSIMLIHMAMLIMVSKGISFNKKMMTCYTVNYIMLALFCILWFAFALSHSTTRKNVMDWIMCGLIILPTLLTAILYSPQIITNLKSSIKDALNKCKRKKKPLC